MNFKYDIFVSYSRKDKNVIEPIIRQLRRAGLSCWMDMDGIYHGDLFKEKIVDAIDESCVFLFFSSKNSNKSSWTAKEIGIASSHNKTIIPVKLDSTQYHKSVEFDICNLDYVDYSIEQSQDEGIRKLIESVCRINGINPILSNTDEELYEEGKKAYKSGLYSKAFDLFMRSAREGNVNAQYNLGVMYSKGKRVIKDDKEAFNWFLSASQQGDIDAHYSVGIRYQQGVGVEEDQKLAVKHLGVAAEKGLKSAQCYLADMFYYGYVVNKNFQAASKWYLEAAKQGHDEAQRMLASMYEYGVGVEQNYQEALYWYGLLADKGNPYAKSKVEELKDKK